MTSDAPGVSTATFLLDFFEPSAFLLRFLVGSDMVSCVAEMYSRTASSLPFHCDMGFNFFLCQGGEASLVGGLPHTTKDQRPCDHTQMEFTDEKELNEKCNFIELLNAHSDMDSAIYLQLI